MHSKYCAYIFEEQLCQITDLHEIWAKFHADPFWNNETLNFLKRSPHQEEQQEEEQDEQWYEISSWSKNSASSKNKCT